MIGNQAKIEVGGKEVLTLRDILPTAPGLRVLFVGKVPAPVSVEVGHYFQGKQGRIFWKILKEKGLLQQTTDYEDDSLLQHGYGITDIVKVPREYKEEPSDVEYAEGAPQVVNLISVHRPKIIVFVYKRVLDKILKFQFGKEERSAYGFNPSLDELFGARVFAFPLPGTPCTKEHAECAMEELASAVRASRRLRPQTAPPRKIFRE